MERDAAFGGTVGTLRRGREELENHRNHGEPGARGAEDREPREQCGSEAAIIGAVGGNDRVGASPTSNTEQPLGVPGSAPMRDSVAVPEF